MNNAATINATHAPEPWTAEDYAVSSGEQGACIKAGDDTILDLPYPPAGSWTKAQADATARRIVACVNACAGIDTERLVDFSLLDFRASALDVVRNWDHGDLAGAVANLEFDAEKIGGSVDEESSQDLQAEPTAG